MIRKSTHYKDLSSDTFNIDVTFYAKVHQSMSDDKLIDLLKLRKKVSENFTVMSEDNRVLALSNADEIMQRYLKVKLAYTEKRRLHQIDTIAAGIRVDVSKYLFIKAVVDGELVINQRDEDEIYKDLDTFSRINKQENSYDYLLQMSIRSLTKKRMTQLLDKVKAQKAILDDLKKTTNIKIYREELQGLKLV